MRPSALSAWNFIHARWMLENTQARNERKKVVRVYLQYFNVLRVRNKYFYLNLGFEPNQYGYLCLLLSQFYLFIFILFYHSFLYLFLFNCALCLLAQI